jgi:ABC-type multidrug transport system ATPase subunit
MPALQEPTSGLDSSTAHSLMIQLKSYATHYNKTIITTIHQPSSQVYHMFSTLLLLMEGHVGIPLYKIVYQTNKFST